MPAEQGSSACVPVVLGFAASTGPGQQQLCRLDFANTEALPAWRPWGRLSTDGVRGLCWPNSFCKFQSRGVSRAPQVRVVCSSGGHFARQASGKEEYEGGETRLVSVANFCSLADLQEALERVAAARQGGGARPGAAAGVFGVQPRVRGAGAVPTL